MGDVDNTLKNEKLINKYVACVKQTPGARCPKDAQELKDLMPAILTGTCDCQSNDAAKRCNCSAKQTENAEKIIDFMQDKRMADWIVIKPLYCKPATPPGGQQSLLLEPSSANQINKTSKKKFNKSKMNG